MTLKPGEIVKGIVLTESQPAALRVAIVDESGKPLRGLGGAAFLDRSGQGRYGWGDGSRFGMSYLNPNDRLHIEAGEPGYENYVGPELTLKPGEMRFVKVVLKKEAAPGQK